MTPSTERAIHGASTLQKPLPPSCQRPHAPTSRRPSALRAAPADWSGKLPRQAEAGIAGLTGSNNLLELCRPVTWTFPCRALRAALTTRKGHATVVHGILSGGVAFAQAEATAPRAYPEKDKNRPCNQRKRPLFRILTKFYSVGQPAMSPCSTCHGPGHSGRARKVWTSGVFGARVRRKACRSSPGTATP